MESQTLGQVLRGAVAQHGDRPAYLTVEKAGTQTLTYRDLYDHVRAYAGVLVDLQLSRGDRLAILAENSVQWMICDFACQVLGIVVVPLYATLPSDQAEFIIRDSGAKVAVCGSPEQMKKVECLDGLETLLLTGEGSLDARSRSAALTQEAMDREIDAGDPELPFTIIYTSGTTGVPKGALLPHKAFVHVCWSAKRHLPVTHEDVFVSFLPMSHVFERIGQYLNIYLGSSCGVSKNLMALPNEMKAVRPTLMLVVPRFLENLRERVLDAVAKDKPIRRKLFEWTLAQGVRKARGQFAPLSPLLDGIVASKVRARLGGRMRFLVSGGAGLPPPVGEFYLAMGLTVLQGYGLTETSGGTVINLPGNNKYWTVGEPLDMEIKIAEDGEILVRGPANMLGYYNLPEETAAAIDADGWFHTGDIGEFEGKNLKITDRKKDLIVLGNGKNVAPQPIENRLKASTYIGEAVVLGDGMDSCIALIVPNHEAVRKAIGLPEQTMLSTNEGARGLIKRELDRINKSLASYEMVKRFALIDEPFTIESGILTPTLKVKRKVVKERYADLIRSLA